MQLFGLRGVVAALAHVNEYDVDADHRLLIRLFIASSMVSNSPWPATFVTKLTVGSPTYELARLNTGIRPQSSAVFARPSGPGSRTDVGTLNASYGWLR